MMDTSASLLAQLRDGSNGSAGGRFVDLYAPLVHAWAVRAGLQEGDRADLVQEVFVTLLEQLPRFRYDRRRSFRAWLKTVTLNRWRARQRRAAPAALDQQPEPKVPDPAADFWDQEYRSRLIARALKLMKADFAPHVWRACWLTAAEGRPAAEVAAELGMTVGAVYAARCRVLARLRQELVGLQE